MLTHNMRMTTAVVKIVQENVIMEFNQGNSTEIPVWERWETIINPGENYFTQIKYALVF